MTLAAAYYRVSTETQDLDRQRFKVREYAKSNDYHIDKEFEDKESGYNPDRPAFIQLRNWASQHSGSTIIMAELDRAARNYVTYLDLKKLCEEFSVNLRFINVPYTGAPEVNNMLEAIMAAIAEFERALIAQRFWSGKIRKLKQGIPIVSRVPYGYDYRKQTEGGALITINEDQAVTVRKIFHLFAEKKRSMRSIAIELTKKGFPSRSGKPWQRSTLHAFLSNTAYYGELYYLKNKKVDSKSRRTTKRPRSEQIMIPIFPIITKELFNKAQEILKLNTIRSPRNTKYLYLLSSILVCGKCGKLYSAYTTSYGGHFYRCRSRDMIDDKGERTYCKNRIVKADDIEPHIWRWASYLTMKPDIIKKRYEELEKTTKETLEELSFRNTSLEKRLVNIKDKQDDFIQGYNQGRYTEEMLARYTKVTQEDKEKLEKEIGENAMRIEALRSTLGTNWKRYVDKMKHEKFTSDDLDHLPFERKQTITRQFIKSVAILPEKGHFKITFTLAVPEARGDTLELRPSRLKNVDPVNIPLLSQYLQYIKEVNFLLYPHYLPFENPYSKYDMTTALERC